MRILGVVMLALWAGPVGADESRVLGRKELPQYLYHWMTRESLEALARRPSRRGELPLKPPSRAAATVLIPALKGRPALFAWTNPVTGLGASNQREITGIRMRGSEVYAAFESQDAEGRRAATGGPRGIRMEISRRARAARIVTSIKEPRPPLLLDLQDFDLILHVAYGNLGDAQPQFQEWIVLHPAAVESFTAGHEVLVTSLRDELRRLRKPGFTYPTEARLFLENNPFNDPAKVAPYVRRVIRALEANGDRDVPPQFLRQ